MHRWRLRSSPPGSSRRASWPPHPPGRLGAGDGAAAPRAAGARLQPAGDPAPSGPGRPGDGLARLQPLLTDALEKGAAVALFTDNAPPGLPSAVEVNPLETLNEALAWADYLALDLPASELPGLARRLGVERGLRHLPCPAQALVGLPLPCGGLADCGACAVETRRGWKLACQDGPVFDLIDLLPRM